MAPFLGGTGGWLYAFLAAAVSTLMAIIRDYATANSNGKQDLFPLKYVIFTTVIFSIIGIFLFEVMKAGQYLSTVIHWSMSA